MTEVAPEAIALRISMLAGPQQELHLFGVFHA
jgi:hypothetical protein